MGAPSAWWTWPTGAGSSGRTRNAFSSAVVTAAAFRPDGQIRWIDETGLVHEEAVESLGAEGRLPEVRTRAHERAQFSADGSRLVVTARGSPAFAVVESSGPTLIGRDVGEEGATDSGRSVVVGAGTVDSRLPGEPAWERGVPSELQGVGATAPSVSPDGEAVAVIAGLPDGRRAVIAGQPDAGAPCDVGSGFYSVVALGDGGAVVAVGQDDQDRVCVAAGGEEAPNRLPLLTGETLQSLAVSATGEAHGPRHGVRRRRLRRRLRRRRRTSRRSPAAGRRDGGRSLPGRHPIRRRRR